MFNSTLYYGRTSQWALLFIVKLHSKQRNNILGSMSYEIREWYSKMGRIDMNDNETVG